MVNTRFFSLKKFLKNNREMDKENVKHTHTHTTLSFNLKKQGNSDTYYNMDEP
jgi:hypothetical protein